jgi:hypothetical protein
MLAVPVDQLSDFTMQKVEEAGHLQRRPGAEKSVVVVAHEVDVVDLNAVTTLTFRDNAYN